MEQSEITSEFVFHRKIEFHLARKPYSHVLNSRDFNIETLNPSNRSEDEKKATAVVVQGGGKRSDGGELFERGLDPELSFKITFRRIGAGLANLGNTCFLNAVLQCLTYTEPFAAYLQSGKHKSSCRTAGFCAMCALQNHVMNALQSTGKILAPSHLVRNLRCISRNFRNSRQEDAHEYMVNLLESMHKCCLPSGVPTESPGAYEKSLVHKIFGGHLRSQVKCMQCSYCSDKFDPFLDLSLEILKADSLRKALSHFTALEQLDGGEKQYQCQRCKQKVRALKQLTVHKAPNVLTIHLKRFGPHIPGQKIDKKVEFGPTLDLKPFVSEPHEADFKYTLYGVLVHAGWNTHSGHYYCYVRTSSGMWHSLDDNQVHQVSEKTVLAQKAYMLFYVRNRSSTIKRSADISCKDSISAISPGNKVVPQTACALNEMIQNSTLGRNLSTTGCSFAKAKADNAIQVQPVTGNPSGQSLCKESLLQKSGNSITKEALLLQNNGHATSKDVSCLQTNGDAVSEGLPQATLSNGPRNQALDKPLTKVPLAVKSMSNVNAIEDVTQLKDNSVPTPFTLETNHGSRGRSQLSGSSNGKVDSEIVTAQPNDSIFLHPRENHDEILGQNKVHENGDASNRMSLNNDSFKMDNGSASVKDEPVKSFSQLNHLSGCIQKQPFNKSLAEHQNTLSTNEKCVSSPQCEKSGEGMLKLEAAGRVNMLKMPGIANKCVQQKTHASTGTETSAASCPPAEMKPKKIAKPFAKRTCFGRNQLFHTFLILHKNKKRKRGKKHRLHSGNVIKDKVRKDINMDNQGASTSEAVRVVAEVSVKSSKKRRHSSSRKENNIETAENERNHNGDFVDANGRSLERGVNATSELLRRPFNSAANQCDGRETETAANGRGPVQNDVMSLLIKQTTVARWDDAESPASELFRLGDGPKNIGYVLDEWDEEYDRGKRKKLKKSKRTFSESNPFQEVANVKFQEKMKVNRISSGNQPLRI